MLTKKTQYLCAFHIKLNLLTKPFYLLLFSEEGLGQPSTQSVHGLEFL